MNKRIENYMKEQGIKGEYLVFNESCHSAQDAANAAGCELSQIVKNVCLIDECGNLIIAIVCGDDRVSTTRVGEALRIPRPRQATPEEILEKTGFEIGGVPSFGHSAKVLIDSKVMEKQEIYTSGGSENSIVRITPQELVRSTNAMVTRIRK